MALTANYNSFQLLKPAITCEPLSQHTSSVKDSSTFTLNFSSRAKQASEQLRAANQGVPKRHRNQSEATTIEQ